MIKSLFTTEKKITRKKFIVYTGVATAAMVTLINSPLKLAGKIFSKKNTKQSTKVIFQKNSSSIKRIS